MFSRRNQKGVRSYQPPPRYSEEHKNNKRTSNSNSTTTGYLQYNNGNNIHSKPPRFQRNQEPQHHYQHDGGRETHQKFSQSNIYKSSFAQPRTNSSVNADSAINENCSKSQIDLHGKNPSSNKNYNHIESHVKNKHFYDASYGSQNQAQQDGTSKIYSSNATTEKNYKNQVKYQSHNNGNKSFNDSNMQRNENRYNNQNTNIPINNTWVWRVGDKCMAKYWEDNRVLIFFFLHYMSIIKYEKLHNLFI